MKFKSFFESHGYQLMSQSGSIRIHILHNECKQKYFSNSECEAFLSYALPRFQQKDCNFFSFKEDNCIIKNETASWWTKIIQNSPCTIRESNPGLNDGNVEFYD